jgi:hypothetical protein
LSVAQWPFGSSSPRSGWSRTTARSAGW